MVQGAYRPLGSYVTRLVKTAHDPGDSQITSHCPFCGSGQVIGRSDGNIECEFCGMTYLVRIQPMFTGMPQNPMGAGFGGPSSVATDLMSPGMVGPDGMPLDPGMADPMLAEEEAQGGQPFGDEEDVPPGEEVLEGGMPSGPAETEGTGDGMPPGMEEEGFPPDEEGELAPEDEGGEAEGEPGDGGGSQPPWAKGKSEKDDKGSKGGGKSKKGGDKGQKKSPPFKKKGAVRWPNNRVDSPEYRQHYQNGWRTSMYASPDSLERADARGHPSSWYDGYMDYAVGRPKWHALKCPSSEHEQEGCSLMTEGSRRHADAQVQVQRTLRPQRSRYGTDEIPGSSGGVCSCKGCESHPGRQCYTQVLQAGNKCVGCRNQARKNSQVEAVYRTIAGDLLPEDAYIRHLACLHGGVEVLRRPA